MESENRRKQVLWSVTYDESGCETQIQICLEPSQRCRYSTRVPVEGHVRYLVMNIQWAVPCSTLWCSLIQLFKVFTFWLTTMIDRWSIPEWQRLPIGKASSFQCWIYICLMLNVSCSLFTSIHLTCVLWSFFTKILLYPILCPDWLFSHSVMSWLLVIIISSF